MDFVQSASGATVLAIGGLIAYLALWIWSSQPNQSHRRLILIVTTVMGAMVFVANQFARAFGLWDWWGYALPLLVQAGLLLLLPSILFTFILICYRWLVDHTQHPLLWYGLIGVVVLVPVTVLGDLYSLERGRIAFGRGYTIWQDVLLGQIFFWLPVLLYQIILPRAHQISV